MVSHSYQKMDADHDCSMWSRSILSYVIQRSACFPVASKFHNKQSKLLSLRDLPEELLFEIVGGGLSPASFLRFRSVSCTFRQILDREAIWEMVSLSQWPIAAPTCGTWRYFVLYGGGARYGKLLFSHLKVMNEQFLKCPDGHQLERFHTESDRFYCDLCRSETAFRPHGTLMWGCRDCNYDICENCVKMNVTDTAPGTENTGNAEGWTALHYACRLGLTDVVALLLDARADVEVQDIRHGYTPLMVSATHGYADVCSLLLSKGAATDTVNHSGKTARACAVSWDRKGLLSILSAGSESCSN